LQRLKPDIDFAGLGGTSELVPGYKTRPEGPFWQALKSCPVTGLAQMKILNKV
jgi:hypothetical protein